MKYLFAILIFIVVVLPFVFTPTAYALPEYATRTGEPCNSCHVSAAGGGLRSPRGQAWVAQSKTNTVPPLAESLKILGVNVTIDPANYLAPSTPPPAPAPLATRYEKKSQLLERLLDFAGN